MAAALPTFVAIDFETANPSRDSACAVGLVRVEDGRITARVARLIRPPSERFSFSRIHGICWADVAREPDFAAVWAELAPLVRGASFFAAHNAPFDASVLRASSASSGILPPALPFVCTMRLAKRLWNLAPARLPDVASHLGISLRHHDAGSDAEACARILIAASGGPSVRDA